MNQTIKTILNRKSVRTYINKPINKKDLELILKSAMAAPSGADTRPWEFIAIQDKNMLQKLADNLKYGKMLKNAGAAIAICGIPEKSVFEGDKYWICDCSAAAENILLAVESMGLGAVWASCYPNKERIRNAKRVLNLPKNVEPLCVISIGYPLKKQKPKNKFDSKKIHWNKW
jgi:nitroreductase